MCSFSKFSTKSTFLLPAECLQEWGGVLSSPFPECEEAPPLLVTTRQFFRGNLRMCLCVEESR